jgi:hypothetical protein
MRAYNIPITETGKTGKRYMEAIIFISSQKKSKNASVFNTNRSDLENNPYICRKRKTHL